MNWKRWITSSPPTAMWLIDESAVTVVTRDRRGVLSLGSVPCPPGTFETGPVGLQGLHGEALAPQLEQLHQSSTRQSRPALVFPTSWIRCHLLEFESLPRKRNEIEEILRWRLKKLLPVSINDLRVSWSLYSGSEQKSRRLLCCVGLERVFDALEGLLAGLKVRPGLIVPSFLGLAQGLAEQETPRLMVVQEKNLLSSLLITSGVPQLVRTKPMPAGDDTWSRAGGEFRLVHGYIREKLGLKGPLEVMVLGQSREIEEALRQWWIDHDDVQVQDARANYQQPGVDEKLGVLGMTLVQSILAGEPI